MAEQTAETKTENTEAPAADGQKKAPETFRTILGEKIGMTQVYHPKDKQLYDVTVVKAGPCPVLRVKTADSKDGYAAVQLGYGSKKEKACSQAELGQFKKAGVAPQRVVREVRYANLAGLEAGQIVSVDTALKAGMFVDVQGTSKGHGFAGVMKRHNFLGMPASHGASDKERSPGSLASRRALGRVLPGQRMAGHMGAETVSTMKIEVVQIDPEKNLVYVNGPVPGPKGGFVTISETVKAKKARTEIQKPTVRKDKMGNIISAKKPSAPKKA